MRDITGGRPLVFSHIPKTAGTSLRAALREVLQPPVYVEGWDLSLFGGYDGIDDVRSTMRRMIFRGPDELPADASLVAGHIAPATTMARYPEADHITFLRVPQVRVLSQWLHNRALTELDLRHWGSTAQALRLARLPLRDYLQRPMIAPSTDNTITRFLAWPHPRLSERAFIDDRDDEAVLTAARDRLNRFAHVDVVENSAFLGRLSAWLGHDLPRTRLNERTSMPARVRPDLTAELAGEGGQLLDYRTRLDQQLWTQLAEQSLPETDAAALRAASTQQAIERYSEMLRQPSNVPLSRRTAERLYEAALRLDPRRTTAVR